MEIATALFPPQLAQRAPRFAAAATRLCGHPDWPQMTGKHGSAPSLPWMGPLNSLIRAIDRFTRESDFGINQDELTEGGGALLGLALLAQHNDATVLEAEDRWVVRFGNGVCFDPFRSVMQAIDADSTREALIDELHRAELEASSQIGPGLLHREVNAMLGTLGVGDADTRLEARTVIIDHPKLALSIPVASLLPLTRPDQVHLLRRQLRAILGTQLSLEQTIEVDFGHVFPRLLSDDSITAMPGVARCDWLPNLRGAFVERIGSRFRYVTERQVKQMHLGSTEIRHLCLANLEKTCAAIRRVPHSMDGVLMLRVGDGLDSARILVPALMRSLAEDGYHFVAAPHRDALYAAAEPEVLRALALGDYQKAPARITPEVFATCSLHSGDLLALTHHV